jgi:hypothetical protein
VINVFSFLMNARNLSEKRNHSLINFLIIDVFIRHHIDELCSNIQYRPPLMATTSKCNIVRQTLFLVIFTRR